jgi:hypothetical protein
MMNKQPDFDPARSDAIKSMLMDTVTSGKSSGIASRAILIISLTVAGVLLATGGTALALSGRLDFSSPPSAPSPTHTAQTVPTPSPTPSATAVPSQNSSTPQSTIPADCAALASQSTMAAIMPDPGLAPQEPPYTPKDASLRQTGVLSCYWYSSSVPSYLSLDVASDPSGGYADVTSLRTDGADSLGVGDVSAVTCDTISLGCRVSVVAGQYWFNIDFEGPSDSAGLSRLADVARGMVTVLNQLPNPRSAWQAPLTSWATATSCADLRTATPMADVLNSPGMIGPSASIRGSESGIRWAHTEVDACRWSVPDDTTTPAGQIRSITVQVAAGSGWAFHENASGGTPVSVSGAQDASLKCQTAEGPKCWLNVLTDDSWMQLGYGDEFAPDQQSSLIAAAEAILADRR